MSNESVSTISNNSGRLIKVKSFLSVAPSSISKTDFIQSSGDANFEAVCNFLEIQDEAYLHSIFSITCTDILKDVEESLISLKFANQFSQLLREQQKSGFEEEILSVISNISQMFSAHVQSSSSSKKTVGCVWLYIWEEENLNYEIWDQSMNPYSHSRHYYGHRHKKNSNIAKQHLHAKNRLANMYLKKDLINGIRQLLIVLKKTIPSFCEGRKHPLKVGRKSEKYLSSAISGEKEMYHLFQEHIKLQFYHCADNIKEKESNLMPSLTDVLGLNRIPSDLDTKNIQTHLREPLQKLLAILFLFENRILNSLSYTNILNTQHFQFTVPMHQRSRYDIHQLYQHHGIHIGTLNISLADHSQEELQYNCDANQKNRYKLPLVEEVLFYNCNKFAQKISQN